MTNKITINGHQKDWTAGMTVQDALNIMNYTFKMLVVKINGTLVPRNDYTTTTIPEGAEVMVIHLISGG